MKRFILLLFFLIPYFAFSQDQSFWFEATDVSYWQNGEGHESQRVKFRVNIDMTPTRNTCGTIIGYTDQRFILTLTDQVEHIENRQGDVYKWAFIDGHKNKGTCSLYWNNNGTVQLLLIFSGSDTAVVYNMHWLDLN